MNSPGFSFSSISPSNSISPQIFQNCQVCGQKAHGRHFGAVTCRACAAFFRRSGVSNSVKPCKKEGNCEFLRAGWFNCKKCRLEKCRSVGMTVENFQFDRDTFQVIAKKRAAQVISMKIPETMGTFLGRSNLIIFCASPTSSFTPQKHFIDVQFLVEKAQKILETQEIPLFPLSRLAKLAKGLEKVRGGPIDDRGGCSPKEIVRIGKDETFYLWQQDLLKVATWLNYLDDFKMLPHDLQLEMLKSIWKVWIRLENLAVTATGRRQKICEEGMIMVKMDNESIICDMKKVEIDISWCSRYTVQQLDFFADKSDPDRVNDLIQMMIDVNPDEMELSFMLCQLCFHYIGKRYQGTVMDVAEDFLDRLSNDLHDYYVNHLKMPQYSGRMANLMKINNHIQQDIYRGRTRTELALVFDIFNVEFSHPEMFIDL